MGKSLPVGGWRGVRHTLGVYYLSGNVGTIFSHISCAAFDFPFTIQIMIVHGEESQLPFVLEA